MDLFHISHLPDGLRLISYFILYYNVHIQYNYIICLELLNMSMLLNKSKEIAKEHRKQV